jgi:hypothetical protein
MSVATRFVMAVISNKDDFDKVKDLSDAIFDELGLSNECKPQG